jgi:hypothetical protein
MTPQQPSMSFIEKVLSPPGLKNLGDKKNDCVIVLTKVFFLAGRLFLFPNIV